MSNGKIRRGKSAAGSRNRRGAPIRALPERFPMSDAKKRHPHMDRSALAVFAAQYSGVMFHV
jgi:hypothetical protein